MQRTEQHDETKDIERAAGGDVAAFERLYRRHVARVFTLSLRMLGNRAQAEEATQEIFFLVWRKLGSYRRRAPFGAWLAQVARNALLNQLRQQQRHQPEVGNSRNAEVEERVVADEPTWPGRTDDVLALESAIAGLPDGARHVLVLYHLEGFRHAEIATELGISVGTSKSQLHRAKHLLRSVLGVRF